MENLVKPFEDIDTEFLCKSTMTVNSTDVVEIAKSIQDANHFSKKKFTAKDKNGKEQVKEIANFMLCFKAHDISEEFSETNMRQYKEKGEEIGKKLVGLGNNIKELVGNVIQYNINLPRIEEEIEDITDWQKFHVTGWTNHIMFKYAVYILILTTDEEISTYAELSDRKKKRCNAILFSGDVQDYMKSKNIQYGDIFKSRYQRAIKEMKNEL